MRTKFLLETWREKISGRANGTEMNHEEIEWDGVDRIHVEGFVNALMGIRGP
jgi:hypothetical protein